LHRFAPSAGLRELLDSYRGGLALERLYRAALVRYRLIVAEKLSDLGAGGPAGTATTPRRLPGRTTCTPP
jgi:hypothetical protein